MIPYNGWKVASQNDAVQMMQIQLRNTDSHHHQFITNLIGEYICIFFYFQESQKMKRIDNVFRK
jgi:hypothetical protein